MRGLTCLAGLVAAVAVAIGSIAKLKPELFFRLPQGWLLWAATGGHVPPHLDPSVWSEANSKLFLESGDVVVATGVKSGTVWLLTILHLLRTGGDDSYDCVLDWIGLAEFVDYPGQRAEQIIENQLRRKRENPSLRPWIWYGHSSPGQKTAGLIPSAHPDIKYIAITRDGKEVIKSLHSFLPSYSGPFSKLWGGYPPSVVTPESVVDMLANDVPHVYWHYVRDWWRVRHEPNVLLLHYSDLKKDLKSNLRKIVEFLGMNVSQDILNTVEEKASFAHMKKHHGKKVVLCGLGYPDEEKMCYVEEGGHINKGEIGSAGSFFTEKMNRTWDKLVEQHFASQPWLADWAAKGGPFP